MNIMLLSILLIKGSNLLLKVLTFYLIIRVLIIRLKTKLQFGSPNFGNLPLSRVQACNIYRTILVCFMLQILRPELRTDYNQDCH